MLYRFLSALQQNRAKSRLLYSFYDKESINFLAHSAKIFFPNEEKVAAACICSLIRHAKIGQSQSLLEFFKHFYCLKRQQLSITNWTSAVLVPSCFGEKYDRIKHRFLVLFNNKDPRVSSPEYSGRIVTHENMHFSKSSRLADENSKC